MLIRKATLRGWLLVGLSCLGLAQGESSVISTNNNRVNANIANMPNVTMFTNSPYTSLHFTPASSRIVRIPTSFPVPSMKNEHHAPFTHDRHSLRIQKVDTLVPPKLATRKLGVSFSLTKDAIVEFGWFQLIPASERPPDDQLPAPDEPAPEPVPVPKAISPLPDPIVVALAAYQARESILLDHLQRKGPVDRDSERAVFLATWERKLQQDEDKSARERKAMRDQRIATNFKVMNALLKDPVSLVSCYHCEPCANLSSLSQTGLTVYRGRSAPRTLPTRPKLKHSSDLQIHSVSLGVPSLLRILC